MDGGAVNGRRGSCERRAVPTSGSGDLGVAGDDIGGRESRAGPWRGYRRGGGVLG